MSNLMCGKCGSPFRAVCEACASSALREVTTERDEALELVRSQDALVSVKEACVANLIKERDTALAALAQAKARLLMAGDFDLPDGKGWISREGEVWNLYRGLGSDPQAFPTADAAFAAASAPDVTTADVKP